MTMIEKVARALANSADVTHVNWEEQDWPEFIEQAKAAIEAMREPNEEMWNACDNWNDSPTETWPKMINAALKE